MSAPENLSYVLTSVLMIIGLYGALFKRDLFRKMIGLSIFQSAIILFFVASGSRIGGTLPVRMDGDQVLYFNPLPQAMMLTAIVVAVASLGLGLALLMVIYRDYRTLDEDRIMERVHQESSH